MPRLTAPRVDLAAGVNQLNGDGAVVVVHRLGDLLERRCKRIGVDAHLANELLAFWPDEGIARHNQAHTPFGQLCVVVGQFGGGFAIGRAHALPGRRSYHTVARVRFLMRVDSNKVLIGYPKFRLMTEFFSFEINFEVNVHMHLECGP